MTTKWKLATAALAFSGLSVVLLTEGVLIPEQLQPNVLPLRLLSVNVTDDGKQAVYELQNDSGSKVDIWPVAELHIGKKDNFRVQRVRLAPVSIDKGQAAQITFSIPDDQEWQVVLRVAFHRARKGTLVFSEWSAET